MSLTLVTYNTGRNDRLSLAKQNINNAGIGAKRKKRFLGLSTEIKDLGCLGTQFQGEFIYT